jgi:hypothetical protein
MASLPIVPNPIVTVNVATVVAPFQPSYQQTGCFVSFGGTNLTPNTSSFLTQFSDLKALLLPGGGITDGSWVGGSGDITDASWAGGYITLTITGSTGYINGTQAYFNISGLTPSQLSGTFFCDVTSSTTITFPLATNPGAITLTGATWATGTATVTINGTLPSYLTTGSSFSAVINGLNPINWNGSFSCTVVSSTSISYSIVGDPGALVAPIIGTWQLNSTQQLTSMGSTFFGQGRGVGVYVLELGYQLNFNLEITALTTWLNNSPLSFYGYLLPDYWGSVANLPLALPLYQTYTNPEGLTYFWTTIDVNNVGVIPNTVKSVVQLVEAPKVKAARQSTSAGNSSEFTLASMFFWAMQFRATSVTRVAPMCFKYVYGVTPYPTQGNGPLLTSFKAANVNYIQTGAEGGIAFTNVYQGVTADGNDYFNWWWTIDWVQIQINLNLSNAIINGSNDPLAPLYYSQSGINLLEAVLAQTMQTGVTLGMVLGNVVQTEYNSPDLAAAIAQGTFTGVCNVNAVPFIAYSITNPSDYAVGEYDGLSTLFIPARGFVHVLVQVVATNIVTV